MSKILATFKFRKPLSGIGNLLVSTNHLLDSGFYRVRSPLNPLHPKHLYLEVFQNSKATHPTLRLDLPLHCSCDETQIKEVVQQINTSKSLRFVADADSISIVSEAVYDLILDVKIPNTSRVHSDFVLKHTFELRKTATPLLDELLCSISSMAEDSQHDLICAFDAQTRRCLQINIFERNLPHPLVVCSRRLKSPKKTDWNIVSQLNLASSYGAHIRLHYDEDSSSIEVSASEPSDFDTASRMRLALSQLQQQ